MLSRAELRVGYAVWLSAFGILFAVSLRGAHWQRQRNDGSRANDGES